MTPGRDCLAGIRIGARGGTGGPLFGSHGCRGVQEKPPVKEYSRACRCVSKPTPVLAMRRGGTRMTNLHIRPTPAGLLARAGDWLAILMVGAWASGTAAARADETAALRERALAALERAGTMECVVAVRRSVPDGHWYANIGYYAERDRGSHIEEAGFEDGRNLAWLPGGQLLAVNLATGAIRELVNDPLGGVRDPFVEGDGRTILFSYRQGKSDHFHLFTIPAEGGEPRRLTDGGFDDIEPVRGPDGEILFVSTRCKRWVNCWATQVAIVHRCDPDGSNIRPISANVEHDNTPWLLPDGRVLFTRWEYVDRS
jgi:hypothetical protein